jgi:CheY-like chemotaxis protein
MQFESVFFSNTEILPHSNFLWGEVPSVRCLSRRQGLINMQRDNVGAETTAGDSLFLMTKTFKEPQTYAVLLADDSEGDRALIREALLNHPRLTLVGEARDGEEVISYLTRSRGFSSPIKPPQPDLLLLDLRMPCKTGYDVLEWLQTQSFKNMLVVVLAGSSLPEDFERCMELGAHAYYVKIPQRQARLEMISSIEILLNLAREGARCAAK